MKNSAQKRLLRLLFDKASNDLSSIATDLTDYHLDLLAEAVEKDIPIMIIGTKKDATLYRLLKAMGVSIVQNFDVAKENNLLIRGVYFTLVLPD